MNPDQASTSSPSGTPGRAPARILLVDDHPIVRQGLGLLIKGAPDLMVCGEAEDADAAVKAVADLQPDLAVVDLSLKDRSGLDLIKDLVRLHPGLPILVLSMHDESLQAKRVLRAGAKGYIMKQEASDRVLDAIRTVLAGGVYLSPQMSSILLEQLVGPRAASASAAPLERLTDREIEVLSLIGKGLSSREIAARLGLSIKTIEAHRENIKDKLDLKNAVGLLRFAMQYAGDLT